MCCEETEALYKLTRIEVLYSLNDLSASVHDEWTVSGNRFVQRPPGNQNQARAA